jgi:hypothetical protein
MADTRGYAATGPGGGTQQYGFFKQNPYGGNPYQKQISNSTGLGNKFLQRRLASDPLGKGGIFGNGAGGFGNAFGFSRAPGFNSPWVKQGMAHLRGGRQNMLNDATNRMAGSGIAAGRGGFNVAGGGDIRSQIAHDANQTMARQYGTDLGNVMDWGRQSAEINNQAANAMAGLYGDIYRTDVNAGTTLLGQGLEGTRLGAADRNQWLGRAQQAYGDDISYNRQQADMSPQRAYEQRMRQFQIQDAQRRQGHNQRVENMWNWGTSPDAPGTPFDQRKYAQWGNLAATNQYKNLWG